jgi:4'-phosphopantetheinyl transferase EntD
VTVAPGLVAVEAAVASLFPTGTAVAAEPVGASPDSALWPDELAAIKGAVPGRRAEFAAGRIAARRCLAALGRAPEALPMAADRAAVWPDGVFGSITHAAGLAIAAATASGPLGVDIEVDAPVEADLWPIICATDEVSNLPEVERGRWVRRIFAAKEALFKAQDPARRVMFGFDAVEVRLTDSEFAARFLFDVGAFTKGQVIQGKLALVDGMVLAGVAQ